MSEPTAFDRLLQRTLRVALLAVLVLIGLLIWRLAVLVQRVERSVVDIGMKLERLVEDVDDLSAQSADMAQVDDVRYLLESLPILERRLATEPTPLKADPRAEIDHLLVIIEQHDGRFVQMENGEIDDELSSRALLLRLAIQRRLHEHEIATAGDFLAIIERGSLTGDEYVVIHADDTRQPLADWLRQELVAYHSNAKGDVENKDRTMDAVTR